MSSRQTVCENCVSVCHVPKSVSRDAVVTSILKNGLRGGVLDQVTVAGTEQDRNLTRWVVWLESTEDVRYLLENQREDRIQVEENVFTVTYKRTDPCDIPDLWLQANYPDSIKRQHGDQQNVQHPQNPSNIPAYYQRVSPNAQIEIEQTNVRMGYEPRQASHNVQSNQYYLGQENTPQHGGIPSQMMPYVQPGNPTVRYPLMPFANAAMVGQNLPQYAFQMNPDDHFEQQPGFSPNMPFWMPQYFNLPASGKPGGYNVPFAGKTTPMFPIPQSGYPKTGYPLSPFSSVQPNQLGPTVDDDPDNSANANGEDEVDSGDEDDTRHEKEQYSQEDKERPTRVLVSNLPSSAHEEYLEMFFENPKTFGVQVKNVELDEESNYAIVEFDDPDDVDVVLGKRPVKMMGQVVDIEVYTPEPLCTIQVKGPTAIMQQLETLELYFDNERKSNGGNLQLIEYDSEEDVVYVSFKTEETAQRVLEKPNHTVNKKNLHVQLYKPKRNKKKLQKKTNKYKEVAEDTTKVKEPVCSVKVKGVKALPSRETFELYFENQRRSGGGDIEEIQTDEEDDDIVYIKYKSEQVARTVADKSHILEEHELDVSLYVPPKPLPSYDYKVLIKGLNPKTTQDCLFNFIEAKSGFTAQSMIGHTQQEDVVMVTMEANRDFAFEKLEKIFANAKLEGRTLKLARVPITDCIIVYNLSDDMTAETIQYYFENQRRSGGGPVRKVVMNDDNTCFVNFTDFKTIDTVLEKTHKLNKEALSVQKYQECLARPEGETIERKLNIPAPVILNNVDPEKIKFINNSDVNKEMISLELKKVYAHIIWPKKLGHVQIECTLSKEDDHCFKLVKTWKTEALRIFEDLMKNIVVRKIDILQDIWQNVLEKLNTVSVSKPEDVAVFVEKNLGMITLAGKKTEADEIARRINEIKNNAMAELEKKRQTITENVTGLKPLETKLLLICKFPSEMKKQFEGLKVNINTKTNKVMFEGSLADVQNAKLKMYEMKSRFQFQMYKGISQMKQKVFLSEKTKEFIVEQLKSKHVTAAWEVQQSGELVVCFDEDISRDFVTSLISESLKESNIALRDESKPLMNSAQWFSELEELNSRFQGKCIVEVSEDISKVDICATEDILDEVVDSVKRFLHLHTVLVDKVSRTRNAHRLIEKHHKDLLYKLSKDLHDPTVQITSLENYEGFEVRGTQDGIRNAAIQLNKLLNQIKFREHTMDKPGLSSHMDTAKGKDSLNTIESMLQCTVTVKKGEEQADNVEAYEYEHYGNRTRSRRPARDDRALPSPPVPKPRSSKQQQADDVQLGNVRLSVIKGEIAKQKVDVIVNTTATNLDLTQGATSASLLKAGGPELQQEVRAKYPNGIQCGEIAITSGKKLKCHVVIHSSVAAWDGNNAESCKASLEKVMKDCLEEAEKQNFTSIAFPAIGTGKLGYPRDVVASSLFNVVGKFTAKSLQDVRFVVYQKDYSTVQAFENEMARCQKSLARQSRKFNLYEDMHKERRSSYAHTDNDDDEEHTYEVIYPADVKDQDYKIGNISVVVKQGDITEEDADCIVNSSNEALDLKRGAVSKAILEKGGRSLAEELDKLRKKMRQNHLVVSSAKGLPCKKIIHVVAKDTCEEWRQIVMKCLDETERRSLNSIAFPALGTGLQMKASDIALTMVSAVTEFETMKPTNLTDIRFVIYQKEMVEEFHKAVRGTKNKGVGWSFGGFVQAVKGIMPWSSPQGEVTYARPKANNNKVTFIINAMSEDIIDKAVQKLESFLEREVEKKVFDDSIIRKMDDNQLMEIRAIAGQHHLNLTLEEKRGYMEISGIASNIMTASDKIYRIIRDAVTLEQQQNSADILSNIVQWYFIEIGQTGQTLQPYVKDLNFKIENAYKNKDKQVKFSAERVTYILNFQKMEEYPEDDPSDVVSVIRRDLIKQSTFGAFEPPATWADMTGNLRVVNVPPGTPEYQSILQTFNTSSGGTFTVNKIERVQNKTLWQQYQAKKKQLENQNAQGTQNERLLWHGTAPDSIDNINAHGFNRSYCGKNAVAYGNGVYFAVDASYSCGGYSQPDSTGVKRVYYCRVLTGEYTSGTYGMRVPPQKVGAASSTDLYDSVVDSPAGPSMFIIFHDTQAYPEYLLSFQ